MGRTCCRGLAARSHPSSSAAAAAEQEGDMPIPYYQVDAFTGDLFAGNPAGVCMLSAFLADRTMQKIAAENRHSQTAFVVPRADGDFDLRWFTPEVEDDLCGHATLASAYVLALRGHTAWPVRFHTRSGVLTDRKSTRLNSSHTVISYAVFCLKKKKK